MRLSESRHLGSNPSLPARKFGIINPMAKRLNLENIAKELVDILYGVYGTILEHGLQDKIDKVFREVHRSHMSKNYSKYKMIKGKNYFKPNVRKILNK